MSPTVLRAHLMAAIEVEELAGRFSNRALFSAALDRIDELERETRVQAQKLDVIDEYAMPEAYLR